MKQIAVLFGGPGNEREVSIKTSEQVAQAIDSLEGFQATRIELTRELGFVDPEGQSLRWANLKHYDFVFIAIHGAYGEDGKIQAILEGLGMPFNGPGSRSSVMAMDKLLTQQLLVEAGILVPQTMVLTSDDRDALDTAVLEYPCVIKPNQSGSSVGVTIVESVDQVERALDTAFHEDDTVMIQEYVAGQELTCGVIKNQGSEPLYELPPVEIVTDQGFFDYHNKYQSAGTQEICPAEVSPKLTTQMQDLALRVHDILGCDGLTRTDFRYNPETSKLYVLEINTIPGQTEASLCPKEAKAIGKPFAEFIKDQIELGIQAHKK